MSPARPPRTDHTHVLLLRGINVGRSNRVSKEQLAAWAEAAGGRDVSTFLASGNVLFRLGTVTDTATDAVTAPGTPGAAFLAAFAAAAREEAELDVPLVLTTPAELRAALAVHADLDWAGGAPQLTQLMLLESVPEAGAGERLAALDHGATRAVGPERTDLAGRFLWMRSPERVSDSPLTPVRLERALGVRGTARNLSTVRVLAGLPAEG